MSKLTRERVGKSSVGTFYPDNIHPRLAASKGAKFPHCFLAPICNFLSRDLRRIFLKLGGRIGETSLKNFGSYTLWWAFSFGRQGRLKLLLFQISIESGAQQRMPATKFHSLKISNFVFQSHYRFNYWKSQFQFQPDLNIVRLPKVTYIYNRICPINTCEKKETSLITTK